MRRLCNIMLSIALVLMPVFCAGCSHTCAFGEWQVHTAPTYESAGEERRYCGECGNYETHAIPKLEYLCYLTLDINGSETVIGITDTGAYDISAVEAAGYTITGWQDSEGNPFETTGTLTESIKVYANTQIQSTTTFEELKTRLEAGAKEVYLTADILVTDTIYVTGVSTIYVDSNHTISRDVAFLGDMFVVGEGSDGYNSLLHNHKSKLALKSIDEEATLTIDGNKASVTGVVKGSAFYITNSAVLDMYNGVVIENCKKLSNERILADYGTIWDTAHQAGGAAIMNTYGTFNMFGGIIRNNEISLHESKLYPNEAEENYMSTYGGAIFNRSSFNMFDGSIVDNGAGRAGAIYNYREAHIFKGNISNNYSATYGGAIYMPNSQYTALYIGKESNENLVTFSSNHSDLSGGAIFSQVYNNFVMFGATTFDGNYVTSGNGGAINASGVVLAKGITFTNNRVTSKGAAVHVYYSAGTVTTRQSDFKDCVFTGNQASSGGALCVYSQDEGLHRGAIATVRNCTFSSNLASGSYGGAIYVSRYATITINDSTFTSNSSGNKGGAVTLYKYSTAYVNDCTFTENTSVGNGGAIYLGVTSIITLDGSAFDSNSSSSTEYGGGALYFTKSTGILTNNTFTGNSSTYNGGGIAVYNKSTVSVDNTTLEGNTSGYSGAGIYVKDSSFTTTSGLVLKDNVAANTGAGIAVYGSTVASMTDFTITSNDATANGGAMYVSEATVSLYSSSVIATVSSNTSGAKGGGIAVHSGGTVKMYGVLVTTNTSSSNGGGVYAYGGNLVIAPNTADTPVKTKILSNATTGGNGGGLYVYTTDSNNGTLVATDMIVESNSALEYGAGMYVSNGAVAEVTDTVFTKNTSKSGAAIGIFGGASLDITGSTIDDNDSTYRAGAMYLNDSTVTATNLVVTNNTSLDTAGAIALYDGANLTITGVTATANISSANGGFIYNSGSTVKLYKGAIDSILSQNVSSANGGAIAVHSKGKVYLYGIELSSNSAVLGGALYVKGATAYLGDNTDSTQNLFKFNSATSGGAMYLETSSSVALNVTGINVSLVSNTAEEDGGAIYVTSTSSKIATLTLDKVSATSNSAVDGGALYINDAVANIGSATSSYKNLFQQNTASNKGGAIYMVEGDTYTSTLTAYNIDAMLNTSTGNGGALYMCSGAEATVNNSTFTRNTGNLVEYGGGAVYLTGSTITVNNSSFTENKALSGGAVAMYTSSTATFSDSTFVSNTADGSGGAIYVNKSTVSNAIDVIFTSNIAATSGGAIATYGGSSVTITGITASGNEATSKNGGMLYNSASTVTMSKSDSGESIVSSNTGANGGAIGVYSAGTLSVTGVTFKENIASGSGGAIYVRGSNLNIGSDSNNVVTLFESNTAEGDGGAIYATSYLESDTSTAAIVTAYNVTFKTNSATSGGAFYITSGDATEKATATIYNMVAEGNTSSGNGAALYAYTNSVVTITGLTATGNSTTGSNKFGGFAYISGKASVTLSSVTATGNTAYRGGFVYVTVSGTVLTILSGTIVDNTATDTAEDGGCVIWSNSASTVITISSTDVTYDADGIKGKVGTILDVEPAEEV